MPDTVNTVGYGNHQGSKEIKEFPFFFLSAMEKEKTFREMKEKKYVIPLLIM